MFIFHSSIICFRQFKLSGDERLINVLITNEVDINAKDDNGDTPLIMAASMNGMHNFGILFHI